MINRTKILKSPYPIFQITPQQGNFESKLSVRDKGKDGSHQVRKRFNRKTDRRRIESKTTGIRKEWILKTPSSRRVQHSGVITKSGMGGLGGIGNGSPGVDNVDEAKITMMAIKAMMTMVEMMAINAMMA